MDCWWKGVQWCDYYRPLEPRPSIWGSKNVTPVLSPAVFEWPPNCLGCECRTQESEWDMKEAASPTAEPTTAENFSEASFPPFYSGLGLSSAFLLCKLSNNQHPLEWDAQHFLKTHTLNYKSTYGWKSLCLSLGGGGGGCLIIRLVPVFLYIFWISVKDKMPYLRKKSIEGFRLVLVLK